MNMSGVLDSINDLLLSVREDAGVYISQRQYFQFLLFKSAFAFNRF